MKQYLETFLQLAFLLVAFGCVTALAFALIADTLGWYDSNGCYIGPFSKRRRK